MTSDVLRISVRVCVCFLVTAAVATALVFGLSKLAEAFAAH